MHVDVVVALDVLGEGSRMADPNLPHPSLGLPGGVVAEFLTHMAYLCHAFVGTHGDVRSSWHKRTLMTPLPCDEFRALVDAERGTALLSFSAHAQPDAFYVRVHGTRMRAEAHLWEPRLVAERVSGVPKPLLPLRNGVAGSWQELCAGVASLRVVWDGDGTTRDREREVIRLLKAWGWLPDRKADPGLQVAYNYAFSIIGAEMQPLDAIHALAHYYDKTPEAIETASSRLRSSR